MPSSPFLQVLTASVRSTPELELTPHYSALFGRKGCAEQSVVQETLDACTSKNTAEMKRAFKALLKAYGRSYHHPYKIKLQLLDVETLSVSDLLTE